jgi:aminopeptidase N
VAHQWWGDLVTTGAYQDEWLQEALAQYSALLWLEKKRGVAAVNAELEDARAELLMTGPDGHTMDSFGPLVWGYRLESGRNLDQWRVMAYGKGAWIFHMLRRRMGDERFLGMLGELRRRFEFKAMTTRDLETLAKEYGVRRAASGQPPVVARDEIESLFDSWVRSTGIPQVRVKYSASGKAPLVTVKGTVEYEKSDDRGVGSDFESWIPLEVQYANGQRTIEWVRSGDKPEAFTLTLRQVPVKVTVATTMTLATSR